MEPDDPAATTAPEPRARKAPNALRALSNRDYALYWCGLLISASGTWMQNVAQGWLVYDLTGSKLYLGIVSAASTLPMLFFTLPGGVIADRFNKRRIVIVTQTLALVQATILGLLAVTRLIEPWHIVLLATFSGLIYSLDVPARQAMTIEIVGKQDLLNAVALNSSAFNGARVFGPAIAGLIVARPWAGGHSHGAADAVLGAGDCFIINAVSYLAVIVCLLIIRPKPLQASSKEVPMLDQIREGLGYIRRNAVIRDLLVLTGVASVFGLQYGTLIPALAKEVLRVGAQRFGLLVSAAGVGAVAAALSIAAFGHLFIPRRIVVVGSILAPIGIVALSMTRNYVLSVVFLAVVGFGMMLFLAVSSSIVQVTSPDELRGRVLSVRTLLFMGFAPLGALQIGWLAQRYGVPRSLEIGGLACLVAAIYFAFRSRHQVSDMGA